MRVFKHQWTTLDKATGRRVRKETKKWYIEWTGPDGSFHREPGYVDRRSTEQLLAKRVREAEQIHAGLLTPSMDMARQPLADHLAEYLAGLAAEEGRTAGSRLGQPSHHGEQPSTFGIAAVHLSFGAEPPEDLEPGFRGSPAGQHAF